MRRVLALRPARRGDHDDVRVGLPPGVQAAEAGRGALGVARKKPPAPSRVVAEAVEIPDDPQPTPVPAEALAVGPAARERARIACILLQQAGAPCETCGRGLPEDVTPSTLRGMARLGPRDASLLARLFNAGAMPKFAWSWRTEAVGGDGASAIVDRAKKAHSVEELEEVARLVGAAMASGDMDVQRGKALIALVGEQRKMASLKQDVQAEGEFERYVLPISDDAERIVGLVNRLVGDGARARLLEFAEKLVLEDMVEEPNKDTGGA